MIVNTDKKAKTRIIVLKSQIVNSEIQEIIDKQKTKPSRRFLKTLGFGQKLRKKQ